MAQKRKNKNKQSKGNYNFIGYWLILCGITGLIVVLGSRCLVGGVLG